MRNLRFTKEYVIVALTKRNQPERVVEWKHRIKRANAGKNLRLCKEAIWKRGIWTGIYAADCSGGRNCSGKFDILLFEKEDLLKERLNDIQETFQRASSCLKSIWKEERFQESRSGNMRIEHFWNCCFDFWKQWNSFRRMQLLCMKIIADFKNSTRISRNEQRMDGEDHDDIQWSYKAVVGTKSFQKRTGVGRVWKSDLSYKAADFFGQEMHGDQEYEKNGLQKESADFWFLIYHGNGKTPIQSCVKKSARSLSIVWH